jgi:hypothetical protein
MVFSARLKPSSNPAIGLQVFHPNFTLSVKFTILKTVPF